MNNQTNIPDRRAVEQKRADIIARHAQRKLYDREKTIALATGVICALIFLGGTALGSYHAFVMIGPLAGVLATASYLIADAVIIWAAVVDYHEDRNPMEWAAWAVKYGLSLYMLTAGGCIAYKLFNLSEAETATRLRTGAATQAYNNCVAAARTNRQRAACRQFATDVQATEATAHATRTNAARPAWLDKFTNHPLFNYLPGILAVLGAALLTLLSKLFPQRLDDDLVETAPRAVQTEPRLTLRAPRTLAGFARAPASNLKRPRPYVRPSPDAAARVETTKPAAPLDALAEKLASLGAVDPTHPERSGGGSENTSEEHSEERSEERSGGGYDLPELPLLQWEQNERGGWEAWHTPEGAQRRRDRTYLGYLGKRQLEAWQQLSPPEFREAVCGWVEQKRADKL